jgi:hypothetical protein
MNVSKKKKVHEYTERVLILVRNTQYYFFLCRLLNLDFSKEHERT